MGPIFSFCHTSINEWLYYIEVGSYIYSWFAQMGLQWLWFAQAVDLAYVLNGPIPDTYED